MQCSEVNGEDLDNISLNLIWHYSIKSSKQENEKVVFRESQQKGNRFLQIKEQMKGNLDSI